MDNMTKNTSKKDRKNWRDINRDFNNLKRRQIFVEGKIMRRCSICGEILEDWEDDICNDCQASIIINEDIPPNIEDFE